ncbi:MAG TPA: hypothetical protein VLD37_04600 [Candidatus Bilamarchaeum sp.]|nr:hypothetical protein [Candidatus Bilamarchaeum sp.]
MTPAKHPEVPIGLLKPELRMAAEDVIGSMPKEAASLISDRTTVGSIIRLSEMLGRSGKMDEESLKKAQELATMCSSLHFDQLQSQRRHAGRPRSARRSVEKALLDEGISETSHERRKRGMQNEELELINFVDFAGNESELQKLMTASRVAERFIEMKDPGDFSVFRPADAKALYEYLFPNENEREDWNSAIVPRIRGLSELESKGRRYEESVGQFHALVGVSDANVVGYTQFSTLPLGKDKVVAYWQYGGVADRRFMHSKYRRNENFREEGVGSAFYVFRHGICEQDARKLGRTGGVTGTILEAEFIGQGENPDDIRFTATRLHIHRQSGAKAIIFEMEDGTWLSAHRQPKLSEETEGIMLNLLYRPLKYDESELKKTTEMNRELAGDLLNSFFDNFLREGFDKADTEYSRELILSRLKNCRRVLLVPPEEMPNIVEFARNDPVLKEQIARDYGSLEEQEQKIKSALSSKPSPDARRLGS